MLEPSDAPEITFTAKVWLWHGEKASWHFVSVPKEQSEQIKFFVGKPRRGFTSVRVEVTLGESCWKTSVFPSKETGGYILPLKATIRKSEEIQVDDEINVSLKLV